MAEKKQSVLSKNYTAPKKLSVETTNKGTFIEGVANAFIVDRGKDIVETDAWKREDYDGLANFQKNPIILFNHDGDQPVGKAVAIQQTPDGLKIKAKLSQSKDPYISRVRDLVDEKILRAFSIGFNSMDEEKDSEGVNRIKSAELYEVSIVSIPMNPDSVFEISEKKIKDSIANKETLDDLEAEISEANHMPLSALFHRKMSEHCKKAKSYDIARTDRMRVIAELAEMSVDEMIMVLRTKSSVMPLSLQAAICKNFAIDPSEVEMLAKEQETDEEEEKALVRGQTSLDAGHRHMAVWNQESGEGQTVETLGDVADHVHKIEGSKIVSTDHGHSLNLNSDEAKEADEEEGGKKPEGEEEETPDTTEPKPKESEQISEKSPEEEALENQKQAEQEGVDGVTTGIDGGPSEEVGEGQPSLELAKQTNVLLGQLIREVQMLSQKITQQEPEESETVEENAADAVDSNNNNEVQQTDDQSKSIRKLDLLTKYVENLDRKLKSINI